MSRRAFVLVFQLLVTAVVVMLIGAILLHSRYQVFSAQSDLHTLRAQYAAEAGVSNAIGKLSGDTSWTAGFQREATPDGRCSYSLRFAPASGTPGPLDSVNNLESPSAADSYLGPGSVPPHTALLIVEGRANGYTRVVEAFVAGGGDWLHGDALAGADKLRLQGNVYVDGYDSLRGAQPVPAGVHSNLRSGAEAIVWQDLYAGDRLSVAGKLSTVSDDAGAIRLLGTNWNADEVQRDQPYKRLPDIDVASITASYAGSPGAPLPASGPVTLNGGNHYYSGAQVINGDVRLQNGARLIVAGDLQINGSVKGEGAVIVDGNAQLYGDSEVVGDKTSYVSVLSSRSVSISGFNGTAFLQTLAEAEPASASSPRGTEAAELWQDVQSSMDWMQNYLDTHPDPLTWDDTAMDSRSAVLASGPPTWGTIVRTTHLTNLPNTPLRNSLGALATRIVGTGPTDNFMRDRIQRVDDLLRAATFTRSGQDPAMMTPDKSIWRDVLLRYVSGNYDPNTSGGIFDLAQSLFLNHRNDTSVLSAAQSLMLQNQLLPEMARQIDQFNYNRLGAAQFRGLVYARGGVVAVNEVTVLGSLVAAGDPAAGPYTSHGVTVAPGQVHMGNSSRFTYVKDMFENGIGSLAQLGVLGVKSWRLREPGEIL
jgi:hypothetical protein